MTTKRVALAVMAVVVVGVLLWVGVLVSAEQPGAGEEAVGADSEHAALLARPKEASNGQARLAVSVDPQEGAEVGDLIRFTARVTDGAGAAVTNVRYRVEQWNTEDDKPVFGAAGVAPTGTLTWEFNAHDGIPYEIRVTAAPTAQSSVQFAPLNVAPGATVEALAPPLRVKLLNTLYLVAVVGAGVASGLWLAARRAARAPAGAPSGRADRVRAGRRGEVAARAAPAAPPPRPEEADAAADPARPPAGPGPAAPATGLRAQLARTFVATLGRIDNPALLPAALARAESVRPRGDVGLALLHEFAGRPEWPARYLAAYLLGERAGGRRGGAGGGVAHAAAARRRPRALGERGGRPGTRRPPAGRPGALGAALPRGLPRPEGGTPGGPGGRRPPPRGDAGPAAGAPLRGGAGAAGGAGGGPRGRAGGTRAGGRGHRQRRRASSARWSSAARWPRPGPRPRWSWSSGGRPRTSRRASGRRPAR